MFFPIIPFYNFILGVERGLDVTKRFLLVWVVLAILLLFPLLPVQSNPPEISQITFINVGQGDSALLQDPNGFDVLIDGGPASAGANVVSYLRSQNIDSLEVIVSTHADADHVGGLVTVLQASDISVGVIYFNGYPGSTLTWNNFVNLANARSIPMLPAQFPAELTWGNFNAYILNPASGLVNPEQNDASVVARIDYLDTRFLFTGDIDSTIEATVVARQTPVAADVLKVAHHGSAYSSSPSFLNAVHPAEGIISVGMNSYGHPAPETLERLSAASIRVWRTDRQGSILVDSDGFLISMPSQASLDYLIFLPAISKPPDSLSVPGGDTGRTDSDHIDPSEPGQ